MDISKLPEKYDILEGLFRTTKSENEFISKLKPNHKSIYMNLRNIIDVGNVITILLIILYFFINNLILKILILVIAINVILSVIRQRMRKYIKKKIQNKEY